MRHCTVNPASQSLYRDLKLRLIQAALHQFHETFVKFQGRINFRIENIYNEIDTMKKIIGLQQLKFLFIFFGLHISIAFLAFVIDLTDKNSQQTFLQKINSIFASSVCFPICRSE